MIKTELLETSEPSPRVVANRHLFIAGMFVFGLLILGSSSYLINYSRSSRHLPKTNNNFKNLTALPIVTNPVIPLTSAISNQSSAAQATSNATSLSSPTVNLQNNIPTGQGNNGLFSNSLQSTGTTQTTGQSLNPNLPY